MTHGNGDGCIEAEAAIATAARRNRGRTQVRLPFAETGWVGIRA